MKTLPLLFLFLVLFGPLKSEASEKDTAQPKPSIEVSFERQSVREDDTINLELLVTNDSDTDLTNASVEIAAPSFFEWYVVSRDGRSVDKSPVLVQKPWTLGVLAPRSATRYSLRVKTKSTIDVGEFNCLFILRYQWQVGDKGATSFVSSEKTLKANLLGSESVAGIPLALAGFIVPGLIFWIVLTFFKVPWAVDGLGDRVIYSVLVSVVLVALGSWLHCVDVNTGISTNKLIKLGLAGGLVGTIVGWSDRIWRGVAKKRLLFDQINEGDSDLVILGKLLELPVHATWAQPMIKVKSGERFIGSLGARTEMFVEGHAEKTILYSLVGAFEISRPAKGTPLRTKFDDFEKDGKFRDLIELARVNKLIGTKDQVQIVGSDDGMTPTATASKQWKADEVIEVTSNIPGWSTQPLALN